MSEQDMTLKIYSKPSKRVLARDGYDLTDDISWIYESAMTHPNTGEVIKRIHFEITHPLACYGFDVWPGVNIMEETDQFIQLNVPSPKGKHEEMASVRVVDREA
jgi:hypothetical protein